jgi:hypothetical protein
MVLQRVYEVKSNIVFPSKTPEHESPCKPKKDFGRDCAIVAKELDIKSKIQLNGHGVVTRLDLNVAIALHRLLANVGEIA